MQFFRKMFLLIVVGWASMVAPARAIQVQPVRFTSVIDPGDTQVFKMTVTNNQKFEQKIKLLVKSVLQDDSGRPLVGSGDDELVNWTKVNTPSFTLLPGKSRTVFFTTTVPTNTPSGAHLAVLIAQAEPKKGDAAVLTQAGVLVSLTVGGTVKESLTIEHWKPSAFSFKSKQLFNLRLKNTGTIEVPLQGKMSVYNWRGKKIIDEPVRLGNNVASGASRELSVNVSPPHLSVLGWYRAKIFIQFGTQKQIVGAIKTIWYGPWWMVIAAALAVGGFIYTRIRHHKKHRV